MDEGTWSMVLGTFRKAPSLVGANVVTDIKIDYVAQLAKNYMASWYVATFSHS